MKREPLTELRKAAMEAGDKVAEVLRRLNEALEKQPSPGQKKNGVAFSNGKVNGATHHD